MIAAAWTCLLAPLAAALLITLGGTRLSRRVPESEGDAELDLGIDARA